MAGGIGVASGCQTYRCEREFRHDKLEPNDVDCVLLVEPGFPSDDTAAAELLSGLPFVNMELVDRDAFEHFTQKIFATDRDLVVKGMVEVIP